MSTLPSFSLELFFANIKDKPLCFKDYTKAFYNVRYKYLLELLGKPTDICEDYYNNTESILGGNSLHMDRKGI